MSITASVCRVLLLLSFFRPAHLCRFRSSLRTILPLFLCLCLSLCRISVHVFLFSRKTALPFSQLSSLSSSCVIIRTCLLASSVSDNDSTLQRLSIHPPCLRQSQVHACCPLTRIASRHPRPHGGCPPAKATPSAPATLHSAAEKCEARRSDRNRVTFERWTTERSGRMTLCSRSHTPLHLLQSQGHVCSFRARTSRRKRKRNDLSQCPVRNIDDGPGEHRNSERWTQHSAARQREQRCYLHHRPLIGHRSNKLLQHPSSPTINSGVGR